MPRFDLECTACGYQMEVEIPREKVRERYRRQCSKCNRVRSFVRIWSKGLANFHAHYSPMHPRANRGRG